MTKESKIVTGVVVVIIIFFGLIIWWTGRPGSVVDKSILVRPNSNMTGNANAKVTVVEFGDFQCPACAYAQPILKEVIDFYKNNPDVNFTFRHFPLLQHQYAVIASEAAQAAAAQGKFWPMYDLLYQNQKTWAAASSEPIDLFAGYAQSLSLDTEIFKKALNSHQYVGVIKADQADGQALGVNSTPTFYINSVKLNSTPDVVGFKQLIDAELKK